MEEERRRRTNRRTERLAGRHEIKVRDMDEVRVLDVEGRIVRVLGRREGREIDTTVFNPLQVYATVSTDDKVRVAVKPGSIGGVVPTLRGTAIDESPAPESDGLSRSITKMWIELEWDLETQNIKTAEIKGGSDLPEASKTKNVVQIASLEWNDPPGGLKQINNFLSGSQAAGILGDAESLYLAPI